MGQFEKIVVLVASCLVTVILVVTLYSPEEGNLDLSMGDPSEIANSGGRDASHTADADPERSSSNSVPFPEESTFARETPVLGSNPRRGDNGGRNGQPTVSGPAPEAGTASAGFGLQAQVRKEQSAGDSAHGTDLLLDDSFEPRTRHTGDVPLGSALVTLEGLAGTFDSSIMEYTWRRGDKWEEVATRLYGDKSMASLLLQFNEGGEYRAPGERILVPVFDGREGKSISGTGVAPKLAKKQDLSEERGTLYKVVDGDSLWVISKKVYGRGSQWEKIYKANTDTLASPDDVKPGMGLRIP
ncbi:MAG: nucleoid-associated protein YgaU [Planctomycetota bacterium]|jgi:nucleoid-associated protein YgaU